MSKHSAQIKKILDYDDQLKGRKQPIEVQLEQARREQAAKDAAIVRRKKINCIMAITHEPAEPSPEIRAYNEGIEEAAREIESQ